MFHFTPASRRTLVTQAMRALLAAALVLAADQALGHHGWAWAENEQTTLQGQVESISMVPPHPSLVVKAADGARWKVDLGNPGQTERSGFKGSTAQVGEAITVLGNRHQDRQQLHMKAVRVTVDGKHYDMYPERIRQ